MAMEMYYSKQCVFNSADDLRDSKKDPCVLNDQILTTMQSPLRIRANYLWHRPIKTMLLKSSYKRDKFHYTLFQHMYVFPLFLDFFQTK